MNKNLIIYSIILLFVLAGCEAPHENPLDPDNSESGYRTLEGKVKAEAYPYSSIDDVTVIWEAGNRLTYTNSSGNFTFDNVSPVDGILYFYKDGYSPMYDTVDWNNYSPPITISLNSIPELTEGALVSSVLNRSTSLQTYKIILDIEINDEDGDVDSVFLYNSDLEVRKALSNLSLNVYENEYSISDLNLSSVGEVIGKEFTIIAKDMDEEEFDIGELTVKRVIKDQIELQSPINSEAVGDTVDFVWTRFEPGYSFHYLLQVYIDTVDPDLVLEQDNISSDDITYRAIGQFDADNYYWVLWVIDEFGNKAMSLAKKFIVE